MEDKLAPLVRDTQSTARLAKATEMRAEDIDNRLRQNDMQNVGFPGKVKGRDPTEFVEQWLLEVFGKGSFTPLYSVQRVHRVPSRPLPPGCPSRTMLAPLLNYKNKEIVLRKARENCNINTMESENPFILTFQQSFKEAKPALRM